VYPLISFFLAAVLVTACTWTDLRSRRIYNVFTYPAALAGVVLSLMEGNWFNLYGSLIILAMYLYFFLSGKMGAGDLKRAVALSLLLGFMPVLFGTLAAGVLIMAWGFSATWRRTGQLQTAVLVVAGKLPGGEVPYGAVLGPSALGVAVLQYYIDNGGNIS
jgi:prepilin peptidase CpaA